jgi:hypothetical protein
VLEGSEEVGYEADAICDDTCFSGYVRRVVES